MQSRRIALASWITALLLLLDAVATVLGAKEGLAGEGLAGPGTASVLTTLLALALADAGLAQWRSEDGSERGGLLKLALLGLLWGTWRLGHEDPLYVPAMVGLTWVAFQAALFRVEPDEDEHEPEAAAPSEGDA